MTPLPLVDLRVLDLSTVIAGPNCARYLADFGADVIKVERADGDSLRTMAWRDERDGEGLWFKLANRGKRTIVLDLKDDADRDVLLDLATDASALVENFRPGRLEKLGLGPDVLHARNPQLVITRISGFGQDGPYAGRPGSRRSPRRWAGSPRSTASRTVSRCCRRWPSPTRRRASLRPSPRWSPCTAVAARWSTSTCWRRCST